MLPCSQDLTNRHVLHVGFQSGPVLRLLVCAMKVFISYGHDSNAHLVERIRRDLDAAGHRTWIDTSEIKAGEDWRRRIVDGIKDSDWILAFPRPWGVPR